jgi:hypothetical protein
MRPEEVFTPRQAEVNEKMYVSRPEIEEELEDALAGSNHILVHGESGSGKSWMYKHTLNRLGISFMVANLANASRLGSLDAELQNLVDRRRKSRKVGYDEQKSARVSAGFADGSLSHQGKYIIGELEPFEHSLSILRNESDNFNVACLVFDNFEQIIDTPERIKDVANCIILLDDERYAQYKVKLIIVGVPYEIEKYFAKINSTATIANRISEINEVSRLKTLEANSLVRKGFQSMLKYRCEDYEYIVKKILYVTDRIPQHIHELCYVIAKEIEKTGKKTLNIYYLRIGVFKWFKQTLSSSFSVIDSVVQFDSETNIITRVLLVIAYEDGDEINPSYVGALLSKYFPKYCGILSSKNNKQHISEIVDLSATLKEIGELQNPIIRLSPNGKTYRFVRPQYRLCIRAMLYLDENEYVRKIEKDEVLTMNPNDFYY